jgi:hypothetical protein
MGIAGLVMSIPIVAILFGWIVIFINKPKQLANWLRTH